MSQLAKFRLEALNAHNSYRKIHGVPPLEYDVELENSAQGYAEDLVEADELQVSHGASLGVYGENISRRTSSSKRKPDITGSEVTSLWYRDIEKFDYAKGAGRAGNFTQLVWRDTRNFGIGKAQTPGRVVVVAHYGPAGNVRGQFLENVPPPMDQAAGHSTTRRTSKEPDMLEDSMLNYRVRARQVDTKEVREGQSSVLLRRELIEYEDRDGRVKQKLVEDRLPKLPRGSQEVESSDPEPDSSADEKEGRVPSEDYSSQGSSRRGSREMEQAASAGPAGSPTAPNVSFEERARIESRLPRNPAEMQKFAKQVSTSINVYRKRHEAKPLRISGELCELAQQLAEELAVSYEKLRPRNVTYRGQRLGQSLASRVSNVNSEASGDLVVGLWYDEGKRYSYQEEPKDIDPFGNFTQMIWRGSQELGVGKCVAQHSDGRFKLAVVCYYYPTGNVSEEFMANVLPPKK